MNSLKILIVISILLLFNSCKKDSSPTNLPPLRDSTANPSPDDLSEQEFAEYVQVEDVVRFPIDSLVLGNGQPVTQYIGESKSGKTEVNASSHPHVLGVGGEIASAKETQLNKLISAMIVEANDLSSPTDHPYPDEGDNKPKQSKIGYVIGDLNHSDRGKDYTIRTQTPACAPQLIHGLDCAGYMGYIFSAAGFKIPNLRADDQRKVSVITLGMSDVLSNNEFEVVDLGPLKKSEMQPGDIIYFLNNGSATSDHIGLIGQSSSKFLYHSFGNSSSCKRNSGLDNGANDPKDKKNYGENGLHGGPIAWSLDLMTPNQLVIGGGVRWKITRIRYRANLIPITTTIQTKAGSQNTITVEVLSSDGLPVKNYKVSLSTLSGTITTTASTDDLGMASATWIVGDGSTPVSCTATVVSNVDNKTILDEVTFNDQSVSKGNYTIKIPSGDVVTNLQGPIGKPLPNPLRVVVLDNNNNTDQIIKLTWTASSGGTISSSSSNPGADGIGIATWTLGPNPGSQTLSVSATDANGNLITGSPITFNATAILPVYTVSLISGNNQSGPVSKALPNLLTVNVVDDKNSPVGGVNLLWTTATGTVNGALKTDINGQGTASWTLGNIAGSQTLTVSATNTAGKEITGSPITFTATAIQPGLPITTSWTGGIRSIHWDANFCPDSGANLIDVPPCTIPLYVTLTDNGDGTVTYTYNENIQVNGSGSGTVNGNTLVLTRFVQCSGIATFTGYSRDASIGTIITGRMDDWTQPDGQICPGLDITLKRVN